MATLIPKYTQVTTSNRTIAQKFAESISVLDFGADSTGATSASAAIQAAINSINSGVVHIPKGTYLIDVAIKTKTNITIQGDGDASQLLVNTDIEVFNSDTTTISTSIFGARFIDFYINKTVSTATTKYDIHLTNPNFCNFTRVRIKSGHIDSVYSNTNVGGIWLDRPSGSTADAFCNRVDDCFIQNNSIYFLNITDSVINGGFVWGHTRQFAIRLRASGNPCGAIGIENVVGIIPSKYEGGIWIDGSGINQIRIIGNEFDGNPLLDTGYGIQSLQQTLAVVVSGNTFWGCDYQGILAKDCVSWSITGNNFWKNNAADSSYDDIKLECNLIPVSGCTISGNSHLIDDARTNRGLAVRLLSGGGFAPEGNSISGETVKGNYLSTGFSINGSNQFTGNVGITPVANLNSSGTQLTGNVDASFVNAAGISTTTNGQVTASGTSNLTINAATAGLGFVGHLYVSATRIGSSTVSTRTIFTVVGYGTTSTITSVATQNGSGGGSTFTITNATNGVLTFTDTSGFLTFVSMTFVGTRGL